MEKITAVILAAGLGTRMKSDMPKVLHPIGSETMLGKVVSTLKKTGIDDIIAVVGHKADIVEDLFRGGMRFVRQPELLGSGDALAHAVDYLGKSDGEILVTCGDTPLVTADTYKKVVKTHRKEKAVCTVLTCELENPKSYGRIMRDENGNVLRIVEEDDASKAEKKEKEINVGTYCFDRKELAEYIRKIELNGKKKEFYLTDIVHILSRAGKKVVVQDCAPEEIIGVNSRRDLAEANRIENQNCLNRFMDEGVTIMDPGTTRVDSSAVIGRDTIIFPNTVIEGGVTIGAGCRIGPFARLRPGTRLAEEVEIGNFVEICRTEIGERTRVKHHTYLGDTSVGRDVNIGAGTITANYDGRKKHHTTIEDEVFIGVGAMLIAPVRIGKGAKVGAGCVVTKNKDVPPGKTVVGIPARLFDLKEEK